MSYTVADIHLIPAGIKGNYDEVIPSAPKRSTATDQESIMSRLIPFSFGAFQISLAGAAMYILCSADVLHQASVYFH